MPPQGDMQTTNPVSPPSTDAPDCSAVGRSCRGLMVRVRHGRRIGVANGEDFRLTFDGDVMATMVPCGEKRHYRPN